MNDAERQPHVHLDVPSRRLIGLKIERLLDFAKRRRPIHLLEVGTGSDGVAHYFVAHPDLRCRVDAVDVKDSRVVVDGYRFHLVSDTILSFRDRLFGVLISNYVIENVGDEQAQFAHLTGLRRVMKSGGVGYLAVPNRWMIVEPRYGLPFLSWLPRCWRNSYLRKGRIYGGESSEMGWLEHLLKIVVFQYKNFCIDALCEVLDIEYPRRRLHDSCAEALGKYRVRRTLLCQR